MMFTSRNKMIVALILAAVVAFTAYTMYAKSCACKKAATTTSSSPSSSSPSTKPVKKSVAFAESGKADVEKPAGAGSDEPKPVLAI